MAHRINLVICDVCSVVPYIDEFFSIVSKIHEYFTASGVTNRYFYDAQKLPGQRIILYDRIRSLYDVIRFM